jgi:ferredoxin
MNTTLYYFSGTGNSLVIAQKLQKEIKNSKLIPIAKIWKDKKVSSETEKVGFIFPLYFWGLPKIIENFIKKIDLSKTNYIFCISTSGGKSSPDCIPDKIIKTLNKKNKTLNAYFRIVMPSNYIKEYNTDSKELTQKKLVNSKSMISSINKIINSNKNKIKKGRMVLVAKIVNKLWQNYVNKSDKKFYADNNCISCGTCQKVCPVNNILLINDKPKWNHKCEECMACIHFCPKEAIQFGEKTKNKRRYHHPEITADDLIIN